MRVMANVHRSPKKYDVVVIGSGAGGGTAVRVLTDLGIEVALLEAGPMVNPSRDFKEHMWPYEVDHRGAEEGEKNTLVKVKILDTSQPPMGGGSWTVSLTLLPTVASFYGFVLEL
jgi:choline dehydrogenase-like flavoprotein